MSDVCSDFLPVPILDISTVRFCSYCFRASDFFKDRVHKTECCIGEITQVMSEFWPQNWKNLKCVDFRYNLCYFPGCKTEEPFTRDRDLVRHLRREHFESVEAVNLSADELESDFKDTCLLSQSDTSKPDTPNEAKENPIISYDIMNSEEGSAEKSDEEAQNVDLGGVKALDHNSNEEFVLAYPDEMLQSSDSPFPALKFGHCDLDDSGKPGESSATSESTPKQTPSRRNIKHLQFTCGHCKFTSLRSLVIKRHYFQNHQTKLLYLCEPCFFVSHNKYTYQAHWKINHHQDPKELLAPIVLESLDEDVMGNSDDVVGTDELVVHSAANHNHYLISKNSHTEKCQFCSFKTSYCSHMKSHLASLHYTTVCETLVNTADDTRTFRCLTCETISVSKQAAANNFVSKHAKFSPMRCELCEVDIRGKHNFGSHLKTELHQEYYRRSLRCPNCQFATLSKKALKKHKSAIHKIPNAETGEFTCDKCNYVAVNLKRLNIHKKQVHLFEKGEDGFYSCDECEFKSANKNILMRHTKIAPGHTLAKNCVRCDICDFVAFNESGMLYHKKMIHGNGTKLSES